MNNKPDCHPETPESGQQADFARCQISHLAGQLALDANSLARLAWSAHFSAKYNDQQNCLRQLKQARILVRCIQDLLSLLPPTEDPTNHQPKADN